jgi:hypothetical protein
MQKNFIPVPISKIKRITRNLKICPGVKCLEVDIETQTHFAAQTPVCTFFPSPMLRRNSTLSLGLCFFGCRENVLNEMPL